VTGWPEPGAEPLHFTATVARPGAVRCGAVRCGAVRCGAVRVKAFYQTNEEPYTVYWEVLSASQWRERQAHWAGLKAERQRGASEGTNDKR
jgi:hypothetical protein